MKCSYNRIHQATQHAEQLDCRVVIIIVSPVRFSEVSHELLVRTMAAFLQLDRRIFLYTETLDADVTRVLSRLPSSSCERVQVDVLSSWADQAIDKIDEDLSRFPMNQSGARREEYSTVAIVDSIFGLHVGSRIASLSFFVGSPEHLDRKYCNSVPLALHGGSGIVNVLDYLTRTPSPLVIDYLDILEFIRAARRYYAGVEAPQRALARALRAVDDIRRAFPEITGVFGGGYPFTLVEKDDINRLQQTPPSILAYFDEQLRYYASRVITQQGFDGCRKGPHTVAEVLDKYGIFLGRESFDKYQFTKYGHTPPPPATDGLTLEDYYARNYFELTSTCWPCNHCTALNNRLWNRAQTPPRNFDDDCLSCRQTMFLLRNVMACSTDIDLVVTTSGVPPNLAERLERFLDGHPEWYAYDTDFQKTMREVRGPLDLFVVSHEAFFETLERIAREPSIQARVDSLVVWLPICAHKLKIGANFALACEPLYLEESDRLRVSQVRRDYARKVDASGLVQDLREFSLYHRQLLSNQQIRDNLRDKLDRWSRALLPGDEPWVR